MTNDATPERYAPGTKVRVKAGYEAFVRRAYGATPRFADGAVYTVKAHTLAGGYSLAEYEASHISARWLEPADAPPPSDQLGKSVNVSAVGNLEARTVRVMNDLVQQGYLTAEQAERANKLKNALFDQLLRPLPVRSATPPAVDVAAPDAAAAVKLTKAQQVVVDRLMSGWEINAPIYPGMTNWIRPDGKHMLDACPVPTLKALEKKGVVSYENGQWVLTDAGRRRASESGAR